MVTSNGADTPSEPRDVPHAWIETPLVESAKLSKLAGCRIFLKLENLQPSGSFKSRGIGNIVRANILRRPPGSPLTFYTSSGGNAGLACVAAAVKFGYPSKVIVPLSTKPFMIDLIRTAGASEVVQIGDSWAEADQHLREVVLKNDPTGVYIPPFDHQDVWDGAATMIPEIESQLGHGSHTGTFRRPPEVDAETTAPDVVVCSVGGGGLFSGLAQGVERSKVSHGKTRILAVETVGADSLNQAVAAKELITLPAITSIATSLGARRVAAKALEYGLQSHVKSITVTDAQAAEACWLFADEERLLVEPACGATVAVVFTGKLREVYPDLNKESKVVLVVCGGSNVTLDTLAEYKKTYA